MALNADETCVCNTNYYQRTDTEGNIQCTLCPDGSTRHIDTADESIIGCGMYSRIACICAKGYYRLSSNCVQCPPGSTTTSMGATSSSEYGKKRTVRKLAVINVKVFYPCNRWLPVLGHLKHIDPVKLLFAGALFVCSWVL